MSKVSIITTVYNGEAYIDRCVQSLIAQTHRDLQLIFVDDASADGSLVRLRMWEAKDSRIKVISLPHNVGLAKARNEALRHVVGHYVGTLDVDDWFSPDAIEKCAAVLDQHHDTDCALFRLVYVYPDGTQKLFPQDPFLSMSGDEALRRSINWEGLHGWYLVRRAIHLKYPFDSTTRVYSDENTARVHYLVSRSVRPSGGVYYYWQNPHSITHKPSLSWFDHLRAARSLRCQLVDMGVHGQTRRRLIQREWLTVVDCYAYYHYYRPYYTRRQRTYALGLIKEAWSKVPASQLPCRLALKPGYMPLSNWTLFRLQEELYFFLRRIIHPSLKPSA